MIPNPYPGIFIIIDGIDGCGKSTQVRLLVEWLKRETYSAGRVVLETKEPDKTGPFGKIWPDAIFIIDVTPEVAIKRLKENGRDMDGHENREVLDRTRGHYMTFFRAYPNCIVIPDSGLVSPDTKSMNIREHVEKLLKQKPACGVQGRTDVSVS